TRPAFLVALVAGTVIEGSKEAGLKLIGPAGYRIFANEGFPLAHFAVPGRKAYLVAAALLAAGGCGRQAERTMAAGGAAGIRFTDVAAAAGVRLKHTSGASGRLMVPGTL